MLRSDTEYYIIVIVGTILYPVWGIFYSLAISIVEAGKDLWAIRKFTFTCFIFTFLICWPFYLALYVVFGFVPILFVMYFG